MQSHDVHHGVVSEISVYQIQCWLSSPRGESLSLSLLEFIRGSRWKSRSVSLGAPVRAHHGLVNTRVKT